MADQQPKHPINSIMQYPDQSQYAYGQSADDLNPGEFITSNHMGRIVRFKGAMEFPQGICIETVPSGWYSWFMVRPPVIKEKPRVVVPVPANEVPAVA